MPADSFASRATLSVGDVDYEVHRLDALQRTAVGHVDRLPFSLKILLDRALVATRSRQRVVQSQREARAGRELR